MMTQKNQDMLDAFKKSYILKKANKMAQDYEFIKGFTLNRMAEYIHLLLQFLKQNEKKIDSLVKSIKNGERIDKNNLFLKELNFINAIPKLIRFYGNEFEIDYVFLKETFKKVETEKKLIELKSSLKELEEELISVNSSVFTFEKSSSFNIGELYKFGSFILTFLSNIELREKISIDLLNAKLNSNNDQVKDMFEKEIIQNEKIIKNWSSTKTNSLRV